MTIPASGEGYAQRHGAHRPALKGVLSAQADNNEGQRAEAAEIGIEIGRTSTDPVVVASSAYLAEYDKGVSPQAQTLKRAASTPWAPRS